MNDWTWPIGLSMTAGDRHSLDIEQHGVYSLKLSCQEVRCRANVPASFLPKSPGSWFPVKISFSSLSSSHTRTLFCPVSACFSFLYPSHTLSPQRFYGRAFWLLWWWQREPGREGAKFIKVQPAQTQGAMGREGVLLTMCLRPLGNRRGQHFKTFFIMEYFKPTETCRE